MYSTMCYNLSPSLAHLNRHRVACGENASVPPGQCGKSSASLERQFDIVNGIKNDQNLDQNKKTVTRRTTCILVTIQHWF